MKKQVKFMILILPMLMLTLIIAQNYATTIARPIGDGGWVNISMSDNGVSVFGTYTYDSTASHYKAVEEMTPAIGYAFDRGFRANAYIPTGGVTTARIKIYLADYGYWWVNNEKIVITVSTYNGDHSWGPFIFDLDNYGSAGSYVYCNLNSLAKGHKLTVHIQDYSGYYGQSDYTIDGWYIDHPIVQYYIII